MATKKRLASGQPTEHEEQKALMDWAALMSGKWPELDRLFAIPNGGHRNKIVAARMKEEGVKAGVPDLELPVARCGWHGLFIEMKAGRNKPTGDQKEWLEALTDQGYLAVVCWGWVEAAALIESYLEDNKP
jgi:hypothetical protein